MKKLFRNLWGIIMFFPLVLAAGFFPPTVHSTVKSVDGNRIILNKALPVNGMSGVVIHNFGKGREAITSILVQTAPGVAVVRKGDLLDHKGLPTPKDLAAPGDKVIGGYLYSNVLVLAPNAQTYAKITRSGGRFWVHPDLYAAFLAREGDSTPSPSNLSKFAKEAQVGLIYIVQKNRAILFDPLSGKIVGSTPFTPVGTETKYPFYNRFSKINAGFFGSSSDGDYYKSVGAIR
ncbi:plasminogen-binding N-terminal domain-containing protein [Nitratifractor sp.]|uniref:plasminogen-binding N-terminal domain-containing protein n=1 Tax=Nitratifractor sp. TaxID=2268144 RepID=UPI0025ED6745|nr:plasminogen-binding N-terminal domain-containing protein [Nitratifractor sp.]